MDLRPYTCFFADCAFVDNPFSNRQLWVGHLEIEHGFGPAWEGIPCPLCLEHTENGKGAVLTHFARHMEDIALAALPRGVDSDVESDSETSVHSDSFRGPETTLDEDIRGIGGWMESSSALNHAFRLEATSEKDEAMANVNLVLDAIHQDEEETISGGGKSIDETDKPDVGLDSSVSRQAIESTDVELQRAAEFLFTPPTPPMRHDDGTEVSGEPTLAVHKTFPEDLSKIREYEAMGEPRRPMKSCDNCIEDKKSVTESQIPIAQKAANCGSAAYTIANGHPSATDAASLDYSAPEAPCPLVGEPEKECLAILGP
jgi:hypothetical protein